ncbi:MAG: NUDIX hydrolase [Verrucomicrobia bacterium]|nr:NUDIX hydrolase [Verrucomicrobiota bacterium]
MRYFNKGIPLKEALERSRLGVVSEDGFWVWVREPLLFPDGSCDIYNRFVHKNSLKTPPGVEGTVAAVLALTYGEKIVLNVIFRNATRSWEIELPRGGREPLESAEDAARREAKEETGCEIEEIVHLGTFPIDSAVIRDFYHVFFAKVAALGDTDRENSEVIGSILTLTKEEAKDALCEGKLEVEVQGRKVMAHCRDHSLAYAILLAESKGLL